tara:strand:+ start:4802 stop:5023 length:222 start_codon:yes stop_codon:yes gene_type:complete
MSNKLYVNPLGEVENIDNNDIFSLINNSTTINAKIKNSEKKINLSYIELVSWSTILGISIILILVLLRNINKY